MQWGGDGEEGQCAVARRVDHFLWHVHVAQKREAQKISVHNKITQIRRKKQKMPSD